MGIEGSENCRSELARDSESKIASKLAPTSNPAPKLRRVSPEIHLAEAVGAGAAGTGDAGAAGEAVVMAATGAGAGCQK
jgi:hypothetical protein